jgi:hypothetical protein
VGRSRDEPSRCDYGLGGRVECPPTHQGRGAMDAETVVCDCHFSPMSYGVVSLVPEMDCVMCWMSDCGRYYWRPLGYFCIRPATWNLRERIDKETQITIKCRNARCIGEAMALIRHPRTEGIKAGISWRCLECGIETPCPLSSARQRRGFMPNEDRETA